LLARSKSVFLDFTSNYAFSTAFEYLKQDMLKALPDAEDPAFAVLPLAVRTVIEDKRAPRPQWWYSAIYYLERLREEVMNEETHVAFKKAELTGYSAPETDLKRFVEEVAAFAKDRAPWAVMVPADFERFKAIKQRSPKYLGHTTLCSKLEGITLRVMASAGDQAYAALPERVRAFINEKCLLPSETCHQMFGEAIYQADGEYYAGSDHLLLQLSQDDMLFWQFGEFCSWQFWISAEDLAKRNWGGVNLTVG
jgi:hypothetical protein